MCFGARILGCTLKPAAPLEWCLLRLAASPATSRWRFSERLCCATKGRDSEGGVFGSESDARLPPSCRTWCARRIFSEERGRDPEGGGSVIGSEERLLSFRMWSGLDVWRGNERAFARSFKLGTECAKRGRDTEGGALASGNEERLPSLRMWSGLDMSRGSDGPLPCLRTCSRINLSALELTGCDLSRPSERAFARSLGTECRRKCASAARHFQSASS